MSYNKVQAAREFGRWSQGYDRCILQRLLFGPSHRAIIARVRARSGERPLAILDVGCGTGVFASRIRAASPRSTVWGVDLVSAMLAQGKARWRSDPEHLVAVQGDSERLPFPAGAFDVVTCATASTTIRTRTVPSPRCTVSSNRGGDCSWSTAVAMASGDGSSMTSVSLVWRETSCTPRPAGSAASSAGLGSSRRARKSIPAWPLSF